MDTTKEKYIKLDKNSRIKTLDINKRITINMAIGHEAQHLAIMSEDWIKEFKHKVKQRYKIYREIQKELEEQP